MKIGYARVSRIDQNLSLQIDALKNAGCEVIYEEKKSATKERPVLEEMLRCLRAGDTVVVWKLDRFARSLKHLILLVETMKKGQVNFVSLTDGINTDTSLGQFFLQITGAFAELERNLIIERTNAGIQAARERGVKLGRRKGIDMKKAKAAAQLYQQNTTANDICHSLDISSRTLYRYLDKLNIPLRLKGKS